MSDETEILKEKTPQHDINLDLFAILKSSAKLSGANLIGVSLTFLQHLITARVLGPDLLGAIRFLGLWSFYASLIKTGVFDGAQREMLHLIGRGKQDHAISVQNLGLVVEGAFTILPVGVMLGASFFYDDPLFKYGMILTAMSFSLSATVGLFNSIHWIYQRFDLVTKVAFLNRSLLPVLILITIFWLKAYSLLVAPVIVGLIIIVIYLKAPPIHFKLFWDAVQVAYLFRIGLPLVLITLSYWGMRTVDTFAVATWFSLADLGYFTFGATFITVAISLIANFGNVLQPILWTQLGKLGSVQSLGHKLANTSIIMLGVAGIGANLAQAGFGALMYWFLPKFIPSIQVSEILAFNLPFITANIIPIHILTSSVVNKQNLTMTVFSCGLAMTIGLIFIAIRSGGGLTGVAWSSVWAQAVVSVILIALSGHYMFGEKREAMSFYRSMLGVSLVTLLVFGLFHLGPLSYQGGSSILMTLALRVSLTSLVWVLLGVLIHRRAVGTFWRLLKGVMTSD